MILNAQAAALARIRSLIRALHATTQCVVNEAFAAEQPQLGALPLASFRSVPQIGEAAVSHEGMVSCRRQSL